ncbi:MAG TPA: autotransporter domain-containing protein [Thermoanaerobaculia bacterium]|nr:autotransporter domain-containing protein [Thermoanaerobaculia bacterium]
MRRWWLALVLFTALSARAAVNPNVPEGNAGVTFVQVVFTQPFGSNFTITGNYATVDGTATVADNDYLPASGTFTIPQGQTSSEPIQIGIVGDTKFEPDETFQLRITNVQGGPLADPGPYTFTIINDDVPPTISVSSAALAEGNSGTTAMTFNVSLSGTAATSIVATYATVPGTATSGVDFTPAQGTLTFAPGETLKTVTVNIIGDTLFEENETFTLNVTSGNATSSGTGTIINDDARPASSVAIISGNNQSGRLGLQLAQPLVVRVTNAAGEPVSGVTVEWSVTSGRATINPSSTTDAKGEASTTVVVNSVGPIVVQARVGTLTPVNFTINAATSFESRAQGPVAIPVARALDTVCARNEQEFDAICRAISLLPDANFSSTLERLAPQQSGAQVKMSGQMIASVTNGIHARLAGVRAGADRFSAQQMQVAVNGRPLPIAMIATALAPQEATDAGGSGDSDYNGWSAYISGNLGTGERKPGNGQLRYDIDSQGLTFGVDRLFGQTVGGAALNLMQMDADLSEGNGTVDTSGYALSVYASRGGFFSNNRKFDGLHLDGSLTYGRNTYEAERELVIGGITAADASSENDANVFALSAGTGFDAHTGRTDIDLSLGGTWSRTDIDDLSEDGSGPLLLFVQGHAVKSLTATLGLDARTAFGVPFGTLLPSIRAELVHEFEDSARLVTARFLRDHLNTSFIVPVDEPDSNYGRIGAGLQAVFPFGWSASIEANQDVMRNDLKFRNLQFTVYKSF